MGLGGWAGRPPDSRRDAGATKTGAFFLSADNVSKRSASVSPAMADASGPRAPLWATLVATFFGIGNLRPGPGTWGSAATVVLWWLLTRWIAPGWLPWAAVLLALAAVLAGIPAATRVARASGRKDPQFVVIDEVAGQLITLIAAPLSVAISSARLYTFPRVRYRQAVAGAPSRTPPRGSGYRGR